MHEHVSVSHENYSFNKHLRKHRFYSAEVDSSVKNKVLAFHLQNLSFFGYWTGGSGGLLCSLLEIESSDPMCWVKFPAYRDLRVNFSLKVQF